jgi:hypothetical protein
LIEAKVILDSLPQNSRSERLTTVQVRMPRIVLAEFNTHRAFSRNSASSRARPFARQAEAVLTDPFVPIEWASEKSGMQGGASIENTDKAEALWLEARDLALAKAQELADMGVHKSIVNRLVEPFMWHDVVATSTISGWRNFFDQRCSPLAQPEIHRVADAIREAMNTSTPKRISSDEWHTPYIQPDEMRLPVSVRIKLSVSRCAGISYHTFGEKIDRDADMRRYEKLISADPPHLSPFEHVARPSLTCRIGNFVGWEQVRELIMYVPGADIRHITG